MKNPYDVLVVSQDAGKAEIMNAQIIAMREKKYSLQEIAIATKQLLDPAKRLAADFMFPSKIRAKRPQNIIVDIPLDNISMYDIDETAFDSLK